MDPKDKKQTPEKEKEDEELEEILEYDINANTRGPSSKQSEEGGGLPQEDDDETEPIQK